MAIGRVTVDRWLVEDLLFGSTEHPVRIRSCEDDGFGWLVFEIEGEDVPESGDGRVVALVSERRNRAGQRLATMKFEPATPPRPKLVNVVNIGRTGERGGD